MASYCEPAAFAPALTVRDLLTGQRFYFRAGADHLNDSAAFVYRGAGRYSTCDGFGADGHADPGQPVDRVFVVQASDGYDWFDEYEFDDPGEAWRHADWIEVAIANDEHAAHDVRVV